MEDKVEVIEDIDTTIKMTDTVRVVKIGDPLFNYLFVPVRKYIKSGLKVQKGDLLEVTFRHTGINSRPNPNLFGQMNKKMEKMAEGNKEEQPEVDELG